MATTLSPTSGKNLICQFPDTVGPWHLTWPGLAEPGGWGGLGPRGLTSPGGGRPAGSPILEWEPAPRLPTPWVEEGAGSFINRGFLWLCMPTLAAAILQGVASDSADIGP